MRRMSARALLGMLEKRSLLVGLSIEQLRQSLADLYQSFNPKPGPKVRGAAAGEPPGLHVEAGRPKAGRLVLFFHGGGFSVGSAADHVSICAYLARAAASRVFSPDYRLAPEYVFPAAALDCFEAYKTMLERGQDPAKLALAGISAGANLVLSTLSQAKAAGLPMPAAAVCLSPSPDMRAPLAMVKKDSDWLPPARLEAIRLVYMAGSDLDDPLASPIRGDLAGLPPVYLSGGGGELLLEEICALAARLAAVDADLTFRIFPGMFHCWQMFAAALPEGRASIVEAGAFIQAKMERRLGEKPLL